MFRGRFLGVFLAFLLVVGLLGLAGSSIYRAGWTQGYFTGKISGGVEGEGATVQPEDGRSQIYPYGRELSSTGGFFGGLFKFLLLFFLAGLSLKLIFSFFFWGKSGHRHKGWRHGYGRPPWYGEEGDEPVMKA